MRNGKYHYYRRVPARVAHLDKRSFIKKTLETDSRILAQQRAVSFNQAIEEYWQNLEFCGSEIAKDQYKLATAIVTSKGFRYKTAAELAEGDLGELLARVKKLPDRHSSNPIEETALLGGVDKPALTVTTMLEEFWQLSAGEKLGKSPDQIRKWENPIKRAINNFLVVLGGDKEISKIDRADALDFRQFWSDRVEDGQAAPDTGNRDIGNLSKVFRTVTEAHRIPLLNPFSQLRLKSSTAEPRPPFPLNNIQDVLLAPGTLDSLNEDARLAFYVAADTGCGESELCGLLKSEIILEEPANHDKKKKFVPHIIIQPNEERNLKKSHRRRTIPLVGVALWAMKQRPDGFFISRAAGHSIRHSKQVSENQRSEAYPRSYPV